MLNWRNSGWRLVETRNGHFRIEVFNVTYYAQKWVSYYTYPPDKKDEAVAFVRQKQEEYVQSELAEAGKKIKRVIL